ncbi:VOC family protein [Flavobacterium sp. UMI-01]|uniref:VOC family protein n=1 Tax=Flavobacterium sp. UMI-01 TaxID=1441053 RepID=UPI001C7D172F|nr:VOC family protein [Flavobacterium sp. UMI-01]GIZ07620.1 VOC family protein [Flavobacterium sp. UMI-01]
MANPIYPCLWFTDEAKEAFEFYCSIFPNSKITFESPLVVHCELNGRTLMGLNGGTAFKQSEAVSFVIECQDQVELDYYWHQLTSNGGQESRCGWCKDPFGVSWQVVPKILGELMKDPEKAKRVSEAYMTMSKLDIQTLIDA